MANNFPTIKPSLNLQLARTGILPPDVTFTRASSSGGYYDGKTVVKAEENLFFRSQEFDNAYWTKTNATVSTDAETAPDGTLTADLLLETDATGGHSFGRAGALASATYTVSFFAKYYSRQFVRVDVLGAGATVSYFDIQNGVLGSASAGVTTTITSVGSGWYRCTATFTGASLCFIGLAESDGVVFYLGVITEGAYFWGAQLEQRDAATAYTPTTTQPITRFQPKLEYAIANEPVFDHNPVTGEALGLSIFEARTNLFLRSEEFDNAAWTKTNATISANQIIAPDGTLTADKLIANTANSEHLCRQTLTRSATTHTLFVYAKAAERSFIVLTGVSFANAKASFNLSAGAVGTVSGSGSPVASISSAGNGWFRCVLSFTASASSASYGIALANGNDSTFFTGDNFSGVFTWGAQLEVGAFATPYIPTVASTVARVADAAVMTGPNFSRWFNNAQGCLVIDAVSVNAGAANSTAAALGSANANNRILAISRTSGATGSFALASANGTTQAELNGTHAASNKVAISYAVNDYKGCLNGGAVATDTTALVPVLNNLTIGATVGTVLSGHYKSLQYYPIALTSANLQAVTA